MFDGSKLLKMLLRDIASRRRLSITIQSKNAAVLDATPAAIFAEGL